MTQQVDTAAKELETKKNKGVMGVEDPEVRKKLGIPLDGFDMKTRFTSFAGAPLKAGKKDRVNQAITKD